MTSSVCLYRLIRRWRSLALAVYVLFTFTPSAALSDEVQYIYDHLGRLGRVINDQGEVATYTYDAVGNLVSVTRNTTAELAPQIDSITPDLFPSGTALSAVLTGQNFLGGMLTTDHPQISVSSVQVTDDRVTALFTTPVSAQTGGFQAIVTTALGSDSIPISVSPASVTPVNLTALAGNNLVILDWNDNAEPELMGYHVYRGSASGGPYTKLTASLVSTSYYHDTTAANGTAYYYVVTATDAGLPESLFSNEVLAGPQGTGPTQVCGTIGGQTIWTLAGSPYQVTCDSTVRNSGLLTIEPGVRVEFSTGTGLTVGLPGGSASAAPGALSAVGSEAAPILFTSANPSPAPGDWKGISFTDPTVDASTVLDHVIIEFGGSGSGGANIALSNVVFPIHNAVIRRSGGHGIKSTVSSSPDLVNILFEQNVLYGFHHDGTGSPSVSGSTFLNNGAYPVRIVANRAGFLNGNAYSGNTPDAIEVFGDRVSVTQTWQDDGVPFVITQDLTVRRAAVFTLDPGVEVRFASGVGLSVGLPGAVVGEAPGSLSAVGTETDPVTFSTDSATPAPGAWKGLNFTSETVSASTALDRAVVEYGGGDANNANVTINGASFTLRNSVVRNSSGHGIRLIGGASLTVENVTISGNAGYGILGDTVASLAMTGSAVNNNGSFAARLKANAIGGLSGNAYTGNNPDAIEVIADRVSVSQTWQETGAPLVVTEPLFIRNGAVLTINPGVQVRFNPGVGLTVGLVGGSASSAPGALAIMGSVADPVVFTSSSPTPAPGDWAGILFADPTVDAASFIDYAVVEYGVNNIHANGATVPITNSVIRHASGSGIRLQSSSSTVHDSSITDNVTYGLSNASANTINAENNWWGDPSGPTHPSNPGGTGDAVSGAVDFDPWLTSSP